MELADHVEGDGEQVKRFCRHGRQGIGGRMKRWRSGVYPDTGGVAFRGEKQL